MTLKFIPTKLGALLPKMTFGRAPPFVRWGEMILVLIAEDVAAISLALEDALADGGYAAVAVSSNSAALAWLDDHTPDLAMLDLDLSDGSTLELARLLRSRSVSVLFLSGHRRTLPSDMDDVNWIEKPVSFGQLVGALDSLRAQTRGSQT